MSRGEAGAGGGDRELDQEGTQPAKILVFYDDKHHCQRQP